MSARTLSLIWWRLLVPFAALVFCACLPSIFAADETRPWERGDGGKVSILTPAQAAGTPTVAERNLQAPKERTRTTLGIALFTVGSLADIATTASKAGKGNCVEANPINGSGKAGTTLAVTALAAGALWWLTKDSPDEIAWIPWAIVGGARLAVAAHNSRVKC